MKKSDLLSRLIGQAEGMLLDSKDLTVSSPRFVAWKTEVERYLSTRFGSDSVEYKTFHGRSFYPQAVVIGGNEDRLKEVLREGIETTKIELRNYWAEECEMESAESISRTTRPHTAEIDYHRVFIVHGHNGEMKEATARLLEQQGIEGIILHEQPNRGRTIIEKIEEYSNVGAAIILLTGDDIGRAKDAETDNFRARQNVVFEAGFFIGKYGRDRTIFVAENGIEMPSDLAGVIYSNGSAWKYEVCRELKAIGFSVDSNKVK